MFIKFHGNYHEDAKWGGGGGLGLESTIKTEKSYNIELKHKPGNIYFIITSSSHNVSEIERCVMSS